MKVFLQMLSFVVFLIGLGSSLEGFQEDLVINSSSKSFQDHPVVSRSSKSFHEDLIVYSPSRSYLEHLEVGSSKKSVSEDRVINISSKSFQEDRVINISSKSFLEDLVNPKESITIPERLLMKLEDVESIPDFFKKLIAEPKGQKGVISVRKSTPRARKLFPNETYLFSAPIPYAQPAKCQPALKVVPVEQPSGGGAILWPSCVRVPRCGGCCGGSLKKCAPVQVSLYNMTVIEATYDPSHPDFFTNPKETIISLQQHLKCACKCKNKAEHCSYKQRFDEQNCHCVCKERTPLCPQHMVWDNFDCVCRCREELECSTGMYFDRQECRCHPTRTTKTPNTNARLLDLPVGPSYTLSPKRHRRM